MAVTVVEKKVVDATKVLSADLVVPEVVDAFALAAAKLAVRAGNLKPVIKKVGDQEKALIEAVDDVIAAEVPYTLKGIKFEVILGAKGNKTEVVDLEAARDMLEDAEEGLFMKLASISVTDLKAYLTPDQVEKVTKVTAANKRRVKIEKA